MERAGALNLKASEISEGVEINAPPQFSAQIKRTCCLNCLEILLRNSHFRFISGLSHISAKYSGSGYL